MIDNFSLPETCLICDTIQFFLSSNMSFDPAYVYQDVCKAVQFIHLSGSLHATIRKDLERYLPGRRPQIAQFLGECHKAGRMLFLLTNSPFQFTNAGMSYILGPDWIDLFDIVITSADKPSWFTSGRPFRRLDMVTEGIVWEPVKSLQRGNVYVEGSMTEFKRITKLQGYQVLYLGDHLFSDVREPSRTQGWRTGVIVEDLEKEIEKQGSEEYQENLGLLLLRS
eukprot:TRINITY_DN10119_c0_g2_i5.p1 TRINITY_DN10119_c0_g2~~TRINITY_DN10119_c0_g2_i5.p1  ORF type:complete len:224 (+),score=30.60 TRINITY_DN10119_c0_g2_i5:738-1409(+)